MGTYAALKLQLSSKKIWQVRLFVFARSRRKTLQDVDDFVFNRSEVLANFALFAKFVQLFELFDGNFRVVAASDESSLVVWYGRQKV